MKETSIFAQGYNSLWGYPRNYPIKDIIPIPERSKEIEELRKLGTLLQDNIYFYPAISDIWTPEQRLESIRLQRERLRRRLKKFRIQQRII